MRKSEEVLLDSNPFGECRLQHYHRDIRHREYFIGFCGKIYTVIVLYPRIYGESQYDSHCKAIRTFCYTVDEVDEFMNKYEDKKTLKRYYDNKGWGWFRQKCVKEFFEKGKALQNRHEKMFIDSGHPIFVLDTWQNKDYKFRITYNRMLKDLKFFKIFPTASAYQEISMYLGGVLGQANPTIPEISNKDMIEAKGFDLKTSFRKDKQK